MAHVTPGTKEKVQLVSIPLITAMPLFIKHYMPVSDAVYGVFTGVGIGIGIVLIINLRRKRAEEDSKKN
ncbi:MAG: hypothetical protein ABIN95_03110 [Mucilaginibacter sp.]